VVALDPVNFEKPYTKKLEGVSTVRKSTPPDLKGEARLAHGYPAMTATVLKNLILALYNPICQRQNLYALSEIHELCKFERHIQNLFP